MGGHGRPIIRELARPLRSTIPRMDLRPCHVLSGALLLGAFGLPGCGQTEPAAVREPAGLTVTTEAVRVDTLRDVANASGQVVPSAAGDWTIVASEVAEIAELPKKAGDAVAIGRHPRQTRHPGPDPRAVGRASSAYSRRRHASIGPRPSSPVRPRSSSAASRRATRSTRAGWRSRRPRRTCCSRGTRFDALRSGENRATVRASFSGVVTEVYRQRRRHRATERGGPNPPRHRSEPLAGHRGPRTLASSHVSCLGRWRP